MKPEIIELSADSLTQLRRGTMASFCASLSAEDWLQLGTLSERLRNGLLVLAVRELMKRQTKGRPKRPLGRMVGAERALVEGKR